MEAQVKLFTKSDVERAARLAVLYHVKGDDPESAIASAAKEVGEEAPYYYDEPMVKRMLVYALGIDPKAYDYDKLFEEAYEYACR